MRGVQWWPGWCDQSPLKASRADQGSPLRAAWVRGGVLSGGWRMSRQGEGLLLSRDFLFLFSWQL